MSDYFLIFAAGIFIGYLLGHRQGTQVNIINKKGEE